MSPTIIYIQNSILLKQKLHAFRNATFLLFIATMFINTVFYRGVEEEKEEEGSWNINKARWRAAYRQPLLLSFSFCFVFCIHHCPKKKTRNRAQFTVAPSSHHRPPPFLLPTITLPLPLFFLLRMLHSPLFEEEDQK
jgi:hypothetical protein